MSRRFRVGQFFLGFDLAALILFSLRLEYLAIVVFSCLTVAQAIMVWKTDFSVQKDGGNKSGN